MKKTANEMNSKKSVLSSLKNAAAKVFYCFGFLGRAPMDCRTAARLEEAIPVKYLY